MFIILLKFSANRSRAPEFMNGHNDWIGQGLDEGLFLLVGSLQPGGGVIVAHNTSLEAIRRRVNEDPFVAKDVVTAEILEISPNQADERLKFLLNESAVLEEAAHG